MKKLVPVIVLIAAMLLLFLPLLGCQGSVYYSRTVVKDGDKTTSTTTFLPTGTLLQRRVIGEIDADRNPDGSVRFKLRDTNTSPSAEAVKALADIARGGR